VLAVAQNKKAAGQNSARVRKGLIGSIACERPTLGAIELLKSRNRASCPHRYFSYLKQQIKQSDRDARDGTSRPKNSHSSN
jgi:hypothetical protein